MSSSAQATAGPSFLARAFPTFARSFGNLGWPILLRQLRADFRKNRFFISQFVCLAVLGVTLIGLISFQTSEESKTATQIGQSLFDWFFVVQYLIILLIFPAFSATAFTEERAGLTMDLLMTSTLHPQEIVWGKFLASTVYCLVYVIASIPLLSISFLFGGVQLQEVLVAYAILIGMTLLISMLGVCISSCYASTVRATLTAYVLVFAALGGSWYVYDSLGAGAQAGQGRTLVAALLAWHGLGASSGPLQLGVVGLVAFLYLFLITANRIRPSSDDRSSGLRLLTFLAILGFLAAGALSVDASRGAPALRPWARSLTMNAFFLLLLTALVFPAEEANVSPRNRGRFARWTGIKYPLRLFAPGAFWGLAYVAALTLCSVVGLALAFRFTGADDPVAWEALGTLPFYIIAVAALGFALAAYDFTPFYARLTVGFVLVITCLLPVIFFLSKDREAVWTGWDVLWRGYYLSPFTLWWSLTAESDQDLSQFLLFGVPVIVVARWVLGSGAIAFCLAGVSLARRAGYPLARFRAAKKVSQKSPAQPIAASV